MAGVEQFDLRKEYELLWEQGKRSLRERGVITENLLPPEKDLRRGLGLYFWQRDLVPATQPFLEKIHRELPDEVVLYGFPDSPARQHLSFLGLVATQEDYESRFQHLEEDFDAVCRLILEKTPPIEAEFKGFAANSDCLLMKGYPGDNSFNETRDELREEIVKAGLPPLLRGKVQIFHTTVGRFLKPIRDVERLIALVEDFNEVEIGKDVFRDLHLGRTSWLMGNSQTTNLADYQLR